MHAYGQKGTLVARAGPGVVACFQTVSKAVRLAGWAAQVPSSTPVGRGVGL